MYLSCDSYSISSICERQVFSKVRVLVYLVFYKCRRELLRARKACYVLQKQITAYISRDKIFKCSRTVFILKSSIMLYLLIFFKYQKEPFLTQILFLNNLLNNNNKKNINIDECIKPPPSTPPHGMESHIKPSYLPSNPVRLCHNRTRASSPAASVASLPKPAAQRACVTGSLHAISLA